MTQVMNCSCKHEFQDKKYGKGKRVFNTGEKHDRCTVCGNTKVKQKGDKEMEEGERSLERDHGAFRVRCDECGERDYFGIKYSLNKLVNFVKDLGWTTYIRAGEIKFKCPVCNKK